MKEFTRDWVTSKIPFWERYVLPLLPPDEPVRWLEIGSYEGRSACWAAEVLASRPGSELHCVDIWIAKSHEGRFDRNTADIPFLFKHKRDSASWLTEAGARGEKFDVIYVDGDHEAKAVMADAVLAWRVLKPGGVLVFDDYPWQRYDDRPDWDGIPPKPAIDAFLEFWGKDLKILAKNWQVYLQKTQ